MRKLLSAAVVAVVFLTGACTPSQEPTPSPSPTFTPSPFPTPGHGRTPRSTPTPTPEPTPEPTFTQELDEEQQEAYEVVVEHFTLHNELMKDPHSDWQPLINTVTGQALRETLDEFQRMRTDGDKRVGDEIFHIHQVGEVENGEEWPQVMVQVCTSSADSDIINIETGESTIQAELPLIHDWDVRLIREHGGNWQIDLFRNQRVDSCDAPS